MNGVLIVDKPKDKTSRDVVNEISNLFQIKKIGHTGTLDPMATGVLLLCIGTATKIVEIITSYEKEYVAEILLGIQTDTGDITGNVIKKQKPEINEQDIDDILEKMLGSYEQTVPIYSAVKVNGKKLYEYARNHESITCPKRLVEIKTLKRCSQISIIGDQIYFQIKCCVSKGTYIRSLIEDIATQLHTVGTMSNLRRIRQGNFKIEQAVSLDQIKQNNYTIYPIETILSNFRQIEVDSNFYQKIKNGSLIDNCYSDSVIAFTKNHKIIAIYKPYEKNRNLMKPWKMFI